MGPMGRRSVLLPPALALLVGAAAPGWNDAFVSPARRRLCSPNAKVRLRLPSPTAAAARCRSPAPAASAPLRMSGLGDGGDGDGMRAADGGTASDGEEAKCWNPSLRRVMGTVSAAGMAETAYLTYAKLSSAGGGVGALCSESGGGGCSSVLDGPYASFSVADGVQVPLSAVGFAAYSAAAGLALFPLVFGGGGGGGDAKAADGPSDNQDLDASNRIVLLAVTTAMATFSAFLMSILVGVLHASCPFCVASAMLSLTLGVLSWSSGMIPPSSGKVGAQAGAYSFMTTTVAALVLFFGVDDAAVRAYSSYDGDMLPADGMTSSLVASTAKVQQQRDLPPPPVTTKSSERALRLASDLEGLDARMFGAYWCSHCYEQKQRLGAEAMRRIPYVECAREGLNSRRDLCDRRDVPGYPTWEIGGELYPGEQELDELEDIVREVAARRSAAPAAARN